MRQHVWSARKRISTSISQSKVSWSARNARERRFGVETLRLASANPTVQSAWNWRTRSSIPSQASACLVRRSRFHRTSLSYRNAHLALQEHERTMKENWTSLSSTVNLSVKNAPFKMHSKSKQLSSEGTRARSRRRKMSQHLHYQKPTATSASVANQLHNGRITATRLQAVYRADCRAQTHRSDV